jgi:hypothetical protein
MNGLFEILPRYPIEDAVIDDGMALILLHVLEDSHVLEDDRPELYEQLQEALRGDVSLPGWQLP